MHEVTQENEGEKIMQFLLVTFFFLNYLLHEKQMKKLLYTHMYVVLA